MFEDILCFTTDLFEKGTALFAKWKAFRKNLLAMTELKEGQKHKIIDVNFKE